MSTDVLQKTNDLIGATSALRGFIQGTDLAALARETIVDWNNNVLKSAPEALCLLLAELRYLDSQSKHFDRRGRALLGKLLLDLDEKVGVGLEVNQRYSLEEKLVSGKNSITFRAKHLLLGREVVVKFFRPGRGEGIVQNVFRLGQVKGEPYLVSPIDVLKHVILDAQGQPVMIDVLVFPFVEGMTFRSYLATERNYSPTVIIAFVEQVAYALGALESAGFSHGDVHSNNILVTTEPGGRIAFRLIDLSYGSDEASDYEFPSSDFQGFKFILRLAIEEIERRLTKISLRRYLGARIYTLVKYILSSEALPFAEILKELTNGGQFTAFNKAKNEFLGQKFTPPKDFGILRYEEIENPNVALQLFHPYPELFERLQEFGSAILFGHRGTGKSTYLAALTFFPQVKNPRVDHRKMFGVLFSCRQGEFRKFSTRHVHVVSENRLLIKDILIKKIVRKTLRSLALGVEQKVLATPTSLDVISSVLLPRLQLQSGRMIAHQISEIESLRSTVLQAEIAAVDRLFAGEKQPVLSQLLDENALCDFFRAVRTAFSELNQTRFAILFDDAGAPNVSSEVQALICDLIASTNNIYCIKLSAEKTTFQIETSDGKPLERVHDFRAFTISDYLYLGSGISPERHNIEQYFRTLVGTRLAACGYKSDDIRAYLGDEIVRINDTVTALAYDKGRKPRYGGWHMVWQISDRTARHLIEMISTIFDAGKIGHDTDPAVISIATQTKQIVRFSEDKLRSLMFLPGTIEIGGRKLPLGRRLFEFATSFGRVASFYLKASAREQENTSKNRLDERLAIEVDNTLSLGGDAQRMLNALIRFAIVDDEHSAASFDDGARKPIYIFNRVYCPILGISFRRDTHWRLSSRRFDEYLSNPTEFVRSDKRLQRIGKQGTKDEQDLFSQE
ncbi:MAG: lipopolysaccharide kinase InaA family protein [Nibricoccus sp.]